MVRLLPRRTSHRALLLGVLLTTIFVVACESLQIDPCRFLVSPAQYEYLRTTPQGSVVNANYFSLEVAR